MSIPESFQLPRQLLNHKDFGYIPVNLENIDIVTNIDICPFDINFYPEYVFLP